MTQYHHKLILNIVDITILITGLITKNQYLFYILIGFIIIDFVVNLKTISLLKKNKCRNNYGQIYSDPTYDHPDSYSRIQLDDESNENPSRGDIKL